jgi:hypothetical protein
MRKRWVLIPVLALGACGSDGDNGTSPSEQQSQVLTGSITSSRTLTANTTWVLSGTVFVRAGATLTIEPGTRIVGEKATRGTLVIDVGAQINANGTRDRPIVMTSDQPQGSRARSDWGGLILNGRAPLNVPGGTAQGEGDTGAYGGDDPNDNSGVLRYVRVEFAGIEFSPDNELNGIAFQGVGAGTTIDFIQVHFNKDDGIEFFGGTASAKHLLCTAIGDDSFDWTDGWRGRGQFWIGQQRGDDADQGFESDNSADNNDLQPRSNPTIFNVTLIGAPDERNGSESDIGMLLREGTAGKFYNFIVIGFKEVGLEIDHGATFAQAASGNLLLRSAIFFNNLEGNFSRDNEEAPAPPFSSRDFALGMSRDVVEVDPQLTNPYSPDAPDYRPAAGSPALNGAVPVVATPADGFFEPANFIGGIGTDDWTSGWTTHVQN